MYMSAREPEIPFRGCKVEQLKEREDVHTRLDKESPDMMMPMMSVNMIIETLKEHSSAPAGVKK